MTELVAEPIHSWKLERNLFLAKLSAFAINSSEGNSDRVCDFLSLDGNIACFV